jgi:hypothetical protein
MDKINSTKGRRARVAAVLLLGLWAAGCGSVKLTDEQTKFFGERVVPELHRVLEALAATNACPVNTNRPFQASDVVRVHASLDAALWDVHRDGFAYTLESRPTGAITLLSMLADEPRFHEAMAKLRERLDPAARIDPAEHLRAAKALHNVEALSAMSRDRTNDWLVSANEIQHVAQTLGYKSDQGGVSPGTQFGLALHSTVRPRAQVPEEFKNSKHNIGTTLDYNVWHDRNSGGYVGLYSASTNLSSVDLLVLVYRGKVQAILQRPGALPHRPRLTSASPSP